MTDRKEYRKAWYEAHKQEHIARVKAYKEAHKEHVKAWYEAHKESEKAKGKAYYQAHKEDLKPKMKAYYESHKEKRKTKMKAWREANKERVKAYMQSDVNSLGQTKESIRKKSRQILKQMHLNIPGYQIHHCFTYDDASKFIYISKSLHLKIHKYLKDHNIDADTDHWMQIREIVNSTDEFTYIKC